MNAFDFKKKYGIFPDQEGGFYDVYVTRSGFHRPLEKAMHLWNPIKVLNMARDLPLVTLRKEDPVLFNKVKNLISALEDRVEYLKQVDPAYYKYQIKPFMNG